MAKTVSYANAFTAGEIGPNAWERSDLQQHARGCAEALNMLGGVTGPLFSRGPFLDRGAALNQDTAVRVIRFARSTSDALVLEIGDLETKVWTTAGDPVLSGGLPYSFATPWAAADLDELRFKQVGDVLYVTRRDGEATVSLIRQADDNWSYSTYDFRAGPWLGENPNTGPTLALNAGPTTATSSTAVFQPGHVGSLIRYRESDGNPGQRQWVAEKAFAVGEFCTYDGRVYERVAGGTGGDTGTTPPLHQKGDVSDGKLIWRFKHDGAGVLRITSYVSATVVNVSVVTAGPAVTSTSFWSLQAYSGVQGYPRALAEDREERLCFASTLLQPGMVDMTRTAGFGPAYGDFKPNMGTGRVVDDDAVRLDVGGGSRVIWLASASALIAGCTDGEYIVSGSTLDDPITPDGRASRRVSSFGNADVMPLMVQGPPPVILHVLRSRTVLRETRIGFDQTVESRELSVLAHHIFDRGVAEMAWQEPDNIVWIRLDDGGLAAMTYHLEHQVVGATRMALPDGWRVESLCTAPNAEGGDVLFMAVAREKDEETQRRIWRLERRRSDGVFIDGALSYAGAPATVLTGLDHLEGETLQVVAEGARLADAVVTDGEITLSEAVTAATVGFPMRRRFESLPLDMEGVGSTNARSITATHAVVVATGVVFKVGTDVADSAQEVVARAPEELAALGVKRVRERVNLGGGASRDRRLVMECAEPFDFIIHAYRLEADVQP